jgi:predicted porin
MQKKIIALAVAGLASTAAFAQSNVTIYGSVDAGYSYRWDAENRTTGQHSRSSIDTGNSAGNRLGFKGVEDLGNGLKAVFLLEQGFNFDTGATGQGGRMFGRQAYVGLTGGFGTAVAGRLYTPHFSFVSGIDPFAAGTVGEYRNVWGNTGSAGSANNLLDPTRVDNAVAYISPNFGGFDVTVAYSNSAAVDDNATTTVTTENAGENAKNNTVYALLAKYSAGPVLVGLNVHRIAASSGITIATGVKTVDNYTLGGTFDAKVVKLHAVAGYNQISANGQKTDGSYSNYLLGVTAPVGKATLKASVNYSDFNGESAALYKGGSATQYAFGADYSLSKRTNLYAAYALIDAQSVRASTIYGVGDASSNGTAAAGNPFQQGLTVGLRHQF